MLHSSFLISLIVLFLTASPASASTPQVACKVFEVSASVASADAPGSPRTWGERVPYRSFDGYDYEVTAYPGVHVEVLLRDSWVFGPQALGDEEIRRLVTRSDLLYETYRDLTGIEPEGNGPLRIAMVPIDGAVGYGWRGAKGIEIHEATLMSYRETLAFDATTPLLSHEMAHNFDRTSNSYAIGADRQHAWTSLVQHLALIYEKGVGVHPTEALQNAIDGLEYPEEWLGDPSYSLDVCGALDNDCGSPRLNAMFAYLGLRTLQLHGIDRAPRLMNALTRWQERFGETYDARSAADVYIEILSDTIERDASCYADAWKWYASPSLRQRLASRYGPNPYCSDLDGDGWTPLAGDPDDADPSSHPLASEVIDGRDNDADGVIDNAYFADGIDTGFGMNQTVTPPVVLDGRIDHPEAGDYFRFTTTGGRFVVTASRRGPFEGSVRLFRADGIQETYVAAFSLREYGPARAEWNLPVGTYRIIVSGSIPGAYRLALHPAREWRNDWGTLAPPVVEGARARLAVDTNAARVGQTPTHAVFWVDGVGEIATVPWRPRVELDWAVPSGIDRIRYRVRLMKDDDPLTPWTLPAEARQDRRRRTIRR